MNHTYLWKDVDPQEEDERIGEDFLATESPDVQNTGSNKNPRTRTKSGGGGSWLLRQSIGKGPSLGEKIGESVERAAYKAVTGAGKSPFVFTIRTTCFLTFFFSDVGSRSCSFWFTWTQCVEKRRYFVSGNFRKALAYCKIVVFSRGYT